MDSFMSDIKMSQPQALKTKSGGGEGGGKREATASC